MVRITLLNKKMADVPVPVVITGVKYGLLYNFYAVEDVRGLIIDGWHSITEAEWNSLSAYLGGDTVAGGKLKETGLTYWISPNTGATNEVGFNGRGCGVRLDVDGAFSQIQIDCSTWSSSYNTARSRFRRYSNSSGYLFGRGSVNDKKRGYACRAVKDHTILTNGQTGTYTQNDGKVLRTICINGVEYLADNLAETKYRNGDTIPEVTDNSAWAALETGALCAYDNDWSNVLL